MAAKKPAQESKASDGIGPGIGMNEPTTDNAVKIERAAMRRLVDIFFLIFWGWFVIAVFHRLFDSQLRACNKSVFACTTIVVRLPKFEKMFLLANFKYPAYNFVNYIQSW